MIILGSSGINIPPNLVERYGIALTPQIIVVDGSHRDPPDGTALEELDSWCRLARTFPYALGASAGELVGAFSKLVPRDPEILVVTGSRKLLGTYDAAGAATRTMATMSAFRAAKVRIVDSGLLDIGAGVIALRAACAAKQGVATVDVVEATHAMAAKAEQALIPASLTNLKSSGRASFLKTMAANLMNVVPLLSLVGGEVKTIDTVKRAGSAAEILTEHLVAKVGRGTSVWLGINHGGVADQAMLLEAALRRQLDVRYVLTRTISPALYVTVGRGTLGAVVVPTNDALAHIKPPD